VCLLLLVGACSGSAKPAQPLPKGWSPSLDQLVPGDVDLVARIDWKQARNDGSLDVLRRALRESGLSQAVLDTIDGCAKQADTLRLALRLGPNGFDGDVMAVLTGVPRVGAVPCGASHWKYTGKRRDLDVFEPLVPSSDRSAAALMLRSEGGEVVVVTPGQVDALLRLLRDGPDADRLEAAGPSVLVLDAKVREALLPVSWEQTSPELAKVVRGLQRAKVSVSITETVGIRAELVYVDAQAAEAAGEKLRQVRDALVESDRSVLREVGESAHASLQGEVVRVELLIPRSP
jgi:hypothetical protein